MKKYCIISNKKIIELSKEEINGLIVSKEVSSYIEQVYKNIITIDEVPKDIYTQVQTGVDIKNKLFGEYTTSAIPGEELKDAFSKASFACSTRKEANELIENFTLLRDSVSDEQASLIPNIFPFFKEDGCNINVGARYKWNGKIKKAKRNCHDIKEDNPENTPDNWEDLDYEDGFRTTSFVFAKNQEFGKGDYGFKKGVLYKSKIDNNGWDPELYPDYWEVVKDNPKKPKHRKENH